MEAAKHAISCPMLDDGGVKGARAMLINITGVQPAGIHDVNEACALVRQAAEYEDVQVNFGIVVNESLNDEVKITVIATGFQRAGLPSVRREVDTVVRKRARFLPFSEPSNDSETARAGRSAGSDRQTTGTPLPKPPKDDVAGVPAVATPIVPVSSPWIEGRVPSCTPLHPSVVRWSPFQTAAADPFVTPCESVSIFSHAPPTQGHSETLRWRCRAPKRQFRREWQAKSTSSWARTAPANRR